MNNTQQFNNHVVVDDDEIISDIGSTYVPNGQTNAEFSRGGGYQPPLNQNIIGGNYGNTNRVDSSPWETNGVSTNVRVSDTTEFLKGFFSIVGGTPQVVRRAYDTLVDGKVYDKLTDTIDPSKGIGKQNLINITGSIMNYSATDQTIIDLPNGISNDRIIFFLTFRRLTGYNGNVSFFYVNGYTDKVDLSYSGQMNPDTLFYINEIVEVRTGYRKNGNGNPVYFQELVACDQIISGTFDIHNLATADHSIRPFDLFQRAREDSVVARHRMGNNGYMLSDSFMFTQANKYKKSSRINNNPYDYVSRSIKALDAAQGDREVSSEDDLYATASERVMETGISNDNVISSFRHVCDIRRNGCFKLSDLHHVFPNSKDPMLFVNASSKNKSTYIDSVDLTSRTYEVSIGSALVNAISSVALKHYLTELAFDLIPLPRYGLRDMNSPIYKVVFTHARGYLPPEYLKTKLMDFERELLESVMPSIVPDPDNVDVEFKLNFKITDKCHIDICINAGKWYPQVYPSFCDGLRAPVVATGPDSISGVSSDILRTYDNLYGSFRYS